MTVCLSALFPLLTTLKNFFSNLVQNVIEKLPTGPNKFDINSVREFYKSLNLEKTLFIDSFHKSVYWSPRDTSPHQKSFENIL